MKSRVHKLQEQNLSHSKLLMVEIGSLLNMLV
jgi:hypothetical protein